MDKVQMYVNGHTLKTNPGHAGSGVVLNYEDTTEEGYKAIGHGTNNHAELEAVICGMDMLPPGCTVTVISCSTWLINCANGTWGRNKPEYNALWAELDKRCMVHQEVYFEWKKKGTDGPARPGFHAGKRSGKRKRHERTRVIGFHQRHGCTVTS